MTLQRPPGTRLLVSLLAAGSAVLVTASPAVAGKTTLKDATGDVWGAADATSVTPSPSIAEGDITRAVVSFKDQTVRVRISFAKLRRGGPYAQYSVMLQGRQGKVLREVLVETGKRNRSGSDRVFNAREREVSCDARHRISYGRDAVTVKLDRRCLGSPKAVRANINTARATGRGVFYSDNAHDTAAESAAWSEWVRR
ncbi:MAG: hypothetical protein WBQ50_07430 [Nocardioides sp.]